jgi:2-methylisocitrate lyase-like PEP mutase family enzyme
MEAGYASTGEEIIVTIEELIETGAVGLNLEDSVRNETGLVDVSLQVEKIRAVRETAAEAGVPLVLNARTDAYWLKGVEISDRMGETVKRAKAYREAGGDCIFVPGLREPAAIAEFLKKSPAPMNVLAGPGAPSIADLEKLGVARVSLGGGPARTAMGILRKLGKELLASGTYTVIAENAIPSPEMNAMMRK